ncbi:intercellular adhesin biosynthesis polysaccharide N-deacetylase [Macrococcoides goetzii]|uniref:Poly-beta-1,6-N-acetyl-D-glucosamine N-deacetylase n=1 Tax=Macrococcoides goetzii TaxID=1891097 RepID=A0A395G788_9STAP|nr:intercellular adhesin biosynthesis polysaccharide N-deacetylase [Macrococcus goetzii]RAI79919.1 intercellular adhesin biosynthesis polysaccharide N-deacetylase [Macrococcus goetzii]
MKKVILVISLVTIIILLSINIYKRIDSNIEHTKFQLYKEENSCLALNYHRVRNGTISTKIFKFLSANNELRKYSVLTEDFEQQLKWMKKHGATFVSEEDFLHDYNNKKFRKGCVFISFDDADITTFKNAFPLLEKYQIPATVFVIAGQVGNKDFNNIELADWEHLKIMDKSNLITFQSHTYNMHEMVLNKPIFNKVPPEQFKKDLVKSKKVLKEKLGDEILTFAYPYGNATDEVVSTVKKAGFKNAYILAPKPVTPNNGPYRINRIMVDDESFEHIKSWPGFEK